jgi:hypothetical protein
MLDIRGIEDVIDGCAYLVFFTGLYEYAGHNMNGKMVFKHTDHPEQTITISYDELIRQRDLFEIAY